MGLFQNLLETYERCSAAIGIVQTDADGITNEKKTLLPIFHMTFKSEICVTIDIDGRFIGAARDNKEVTIIIPCTESSSGRSSGIAAHPLCDQLDYVGGFNEDKTRTYLEGLNLWKGDNEILNSIFTYISGRTIIADLSKLSIFKASDYQTLAYENIERQLDFEKIRKIGVRFAVYINSSTVKVWESQDVRDKWINYINSTVNDNSNIFDYLSGEAVCNVAAQHPKNINSLTGNAKLLSCNDMSEFTFRGRFSEKNDAIIIDYAQSQKMHQMLRWLIANYGYAIDTQVIVTWAIDTDTEVKEKPQDNSYEIFGEMMGGKIETNILSDVSAQVYAEYADNLYNLLKGYGKSNDLREHSRRICIAIFDAATTGRMGLVFYQELTENSYIENIVKWHRETSYYLTTWKKEKDRDGKDISIPIHYIGAPSYDDILFAVYGKAHGDKSYNILKKKIRKQLIECMFGNFAFPKSIVDMAANRASHPMSFMDTNGGFSKNDWKRSINITCALARKYYKQQKEEIILELDEKRRDRDYLFGRLLSVADKLEDYVLYKAGVNRPTNAVKLMSAYQVRPYSTWGQLFAHLIPYKNQLDGAGYYQLLIDNIMALFQEGDYENNAPLTPLYLLGYSAQNRALSHINKKNNNSSNNNENEEVDFNGDITE